MAVRLFETKDHASAYLQYRVAPVELVNRIMSFMEKKTPNQFDLAVDVGCGSGQGTILLAPHFTEVVGTDVSPAQLEMALANSSPPNVSYRECPAEDLPFASGEVDVVTAMTAAHWFDRERFLLEADRVLKPGGCLALLSYTMDMELEYADVSDNNTLNDICKEFYAALLPFRNPYIGTSSVKIYSDMFDSCSYPDKEWNDCLRVKRTVPLSGYIGMVETFSSYQKLLKKAPAEAERLSNDIRNKLMSAMKASSPDTEVTVVVKNNCLRVKRAVPLSGYIGMVETFSSYHKLLKKDPAEAERLSNDIRNKLMPAMKASSPDTEVTVVVKYFYWLARKP